MKAIQTLATWLRNPVYTGILIAFIGSYLTFPAYFEFPVVPVELSGASWVSLDPSWTTTLNFLNLKGYTWGKDIAFTYGPLGYLSTRVGWGVKSLYIVLFDLFIAANFFFIFYSCYIKSHNKKLTAALILLLSFLVPFYLGSGTSIVLMAFLLFWIRRDLDNESVINHLAQAVLVILMFFIKLNTGLISFVILLPYIAYKFFHKKAKIYYLLYWLTVPLAIWLLSIQLNVSLPGYIMSGIELISGYNEIMFLDLDLDNDLFIAIIFILLGITVLADKVFKNGNINFKDLIILYIFGLSMFVLYKQAFVRADAYHIMEFFSYSSLFVFCIYDFHNFQLGKKKELVYLMMFIAVFGAKRAQQVWFDFPQKLVKSEYVKGLKNFTPTSGLNLYPNNNQIPQNIKNRIGTKSVDVYPWNIHLLYENKLNYTPRPVFQSYTAYTPYLENLNFEHYNSKKAPDYILYEYESLDTRYAIFDESLVNLLLLKNYRCVDVFNLHTKQILLLEKIPGSKPVQLQKIKEYESNLQTPIVPQKDVLYSVKVENTLLGKLKSIIAQSPDLHVMINTRDGKGNGFKISKKIFETGVFGENLLMNTEDFRMYMTNSPMPEEKKIANIFVWPKRSKYFKDKVIITEYKITQ